MPFIDLNPTPIVSGGNTNPSDPVTAPVAADPAGSTPAPVVQNEEHQNDLLSRLKSFTNFTKDEFPREGEKGLPALEDKHEESTIVLNPQAAPVVTESTDGGSGAVATTDTPEIQEFAGPDFPAQTNDVSQEANPQSLDQKLAQVNSEMSNLVPEVPVAASSTPVPAPAPAPAAPVVSETVVDNDVSDDVVIGTEGSTEPSTSVPDVEISTEQEVPVAPVQDETPAVTPEISTPLESAAELDTNLPANTEIVNPPAAELPPMPMPVAQALPPIPVESAPAEDMPVVVDSPVPVPDASMSQNLSELQLQVKVYGLDEILREALSKGASDVHLNVGYRAIARMDGDLTPLQSQVLTNEMIKEMLVPVVAHKGDIPIDNVYDLDIAYALPDKSARFRVNVYKEKENFAAVFRLIPEQIKTLEQLYLPTLLRQFIDLEQGLILVTGATGSGKSTTIAALVNEINQAYPKHIVTVEDPIEYIYPAGRSVVSQRNVGEDTESWGDALRSVLRQDPNVVVIGEMRDLETISAAMTVAETGHLVFATLHTNSAAQSVDRIIDVFPEFQQNQIRTQLANVLTAVVCQKLVPISEGGRRVAVEIMLANPAVRAAIREHKVYQIDNMIQTSADVGMISMEKSLFQLVKEGLVSPETAQQFANKPGDLLTLLK